MSFSILFNGELQEGVSRLQAQANLADIFRTADPESLDRLFPGKAVVLKRGLGAAQAERYRKALADAGLVTHIRDDALFVPPPPPKPASPPLAIPATLALLPIDKPAEPEPAPPPAQTAELPKQVPYTEPPPPASPADATAQYAAYQNRPDINIFHVARLLLLLDYNAREAGRLAPPGSDSAYQAGYGVGIVFIWSLACLLVASLWASQRNIASHLRNVFYGALVMLAYFFVMDVSGDGVSPLSAHYAPRQVTLEEKLAAASDSMNHRMVGKTDNGSRIDHVEARGRELVIRTTATDFSSTQIDSGKIHDLVYSALRAGICTKPVLVNLLNEGATVHYEFFANDQVKITEAVLTPDACHGNTSVP
jgi:hypothetical protein